MDISQLDSLAITADMLALISEIDEFKGAWKAVGQIAPEQLGSLKKVASIESIGSSTRIEGSRLSDLEVEVLLSNLKIKEFASRDEQEIAGYAEVMNLIFQHYEHIPLTENYILQMHHELLRYSEKDNWHKGNYKRSPNHVEAFGPDGKSMGIIFETATPFETPMLMQQLVAWASEAYAAKVWHPLLITGVFIVKFLEIHPFQDGNGRLSRIITTYLLLKQGYVYIPYSSLEAVIERSKEAYYLSLRQTQGTLKSATPNWGPWLIFFLRALKKQKDQLEIKITTEILRLTKIPALSQQLLESTKSRGRITVRDAVAVTGANRNTIKKHLEAMVAGGYLQKQGVGKGSWYVLGLIG